MYNNNNLEYLNILQKIYLILEKKKKKKSKKPFPDLDNSGDITYKDILIGRGVKLDEKSQTDKNYEKGRKPEEIEKLKRYTDGYRNAKTEAEKKKFRDLRDKLEDKIKKRKEKLGIKTPQSKHNYKKESYQLSPLELRLILLEEVEDLYEKKRRKRKKKKSKPRKISSKVDKSLKKKARDRNAPVGALKAIYRKGMGAFYSSGSRAGQNPHSWAMARVNSVLKGGKARSVDKAQWKQIQKFRKRKKRK